MISLKSEAEIKKLRHGGKILAAILSGIAARVAAGVSTRELNDFAIQLAREKKVRPAFLNYRPAGAPRPYPAALCVSVNDEVVHGIPNEGPRRALKEGDILSLDMG